MSKREKIKVSRLTRNEVESLVFAIATMTIQRDQQMAEMDEALSKVRATYGDDLATVTARIDAAVAECRAWAEAHPEEFATRKSIEMVHGIVGFRTGMPALKLIKGGTWDKVLDRLNNMGLVAYIRTKYEADKEKLLADRDDVMKELLPKVGVVVKQDETFFVEPKRETAPEGAPASQEPI